MTQRRAVIVGAGIGGLSAALALHRIGWTVRVVERAPTLEPVGAGISLWPNALRALDALGVGSAVRSRAAVGGSGGVRRPDGRWLARVDIGGAVRRRFGDPLVILHRADLVGLLAGALPPDTVLTGTTATGVTTAATETTVGAAGVTPGGPVILSTDHGDLAADLLVAADGIRSTVRRALLPAHPPPRYAGYCAWRMVVPALTGAVAGFETWGGQGRRFAVLPMGDAWYCYATAIMPAGSCGTGRPGRDHLADLTALFGGWHDPVPRILAALHPDGVLCQDVEELATPLPSMRVGRVAVLGDAAHAMTPDLGQGGCMAIEDAVVLAAALRQAPVPQALERYSALRLRRTSAVAARSRRTGRLYGAPYPVQLAAARVMGLLPGAVVARGLDSIVDWCPPPL